MECQVLDSSGIVHLCGKMPERRNHEVLTCSRGAALRPVPNPKKCLQHGPRSVWRTAAAGCGHLRSHFRCQRITFRIGPHERLGFSCSLPPCPQVWGVDLVEEHLLTRCATWPADKLQRKLKNGGIWRAFGACCVTTQRRNSPAARALVQAGKSTACRLLHLGGLAAVGRRRHRLLTCIWKRRSCDILFLS